MDDTDYTDQLCDLALAHHKAEQHRESLRLYRAIMLSPTIEICEALLRNEPVPRSALDPVWARRYGL